MLTDLLASARELRNPLVLGYSALLTLWLVAGDKLHDAAQRDPLGRRLLDGLESVGAPGKFALTTFAATFVGSIIWHGGVARLVRWIALRARHPDWSALITEARDTLRSYEQYEVLTYKGHRANSPYAFDVKHTVPSPGWSRYLQERVEERERKASEMSFRVTLAVALVPVSTALGAEGGGMWWWALFAIPVVWLDVALLKYTTLRSVRTFQLEDLLEKLDLATRSLEGAEQEPESENASEEQRNARQARIDRLKTDKRRVEDSIEALRRDAARRASRFFAFLEGDPGEADLVSRRRR